MAKTLKLAYSVTSKLVSGNSTKLLAQPKHSGKAVKQCLAGLDCGLLSSSSSRAHHSTLSHLGRSVVRSSKPCEILACTNTFRANYSTEVEKDLSTFLDKEIQFENAKTKSLKSDKLPTIEGFEITTDGGDVTLTRSSQGEKIVVKLSVNGAVESFSADDVPQEGHEPPQMVCRPPFEVEITKGSTVLALQCAFPSAYPEDEEEPPVDRQISDQFEIQEIAIHGGEWTESTYSVSAENVDAELFDLLMDMLDERGINDEFVAHLIDFCTAYESKQYVSFLQNLKSFADK